MEPLVPPPDTEGCFEVKRVRTQIMLEPQYLGNVSAGVRDKLNRCLMRYNRELDGVPIHVVSATLEQPTGAIVTDAPGVHCAARAKYLVFSPTAGQLLLGEVNAVSGDHIGMLIFDNWNASIPRSAIPAQYEFDAELGRWCDRDFDSPLIEPGSSLSFAFVAFDGDADGAFSVVGSLSTPHTGLVRPALAPTEVAKRKREVDDAADDEDEASARKRKKRAKKAAKAAALAAAAEAGQQAGAAVPAAEPAAVAATSSGDKKPNKKKEKKEKKRREAEEAAAAVATAVPASVPTGEKKKKKKKKKHKDGKGE